MKISKNIRSVKDFIFGIIILALVILISILQPSNKIAISFGETSVDIHTARYSMNIDYDIIAHIELTDKPDMGEPVDGHDDMILFTGTWKNDTWGEYCICSEIATDNCIVISLTDGRTFVISKRDNEETAKIFEAFQTHLN